MSDFLFKSISKVVDLRKELAHQAKECFVTECNEIMQSKCRDKQQIEKLLDRMLDFCFDEGVLHLYRKLCRYYYQINAVATAGYVNAYRDMWDEKYSSAITEDE